MASLGLPVMLAGEIEQGVNTIFCNEIDPAAGPAVAAVRPAFRDIFFASEADATMTAVTGLNKNFRLIDKHR